MYSNLLYMATMITEDCIRCSLCAPECPNEAITEGDEYFQIDPALCTECVGFHAAEQCAAVCPTDACVPDPNNLESEELLFARARALHAELAGAELAPEISRFRHSCD